VIPPVCLRSFALEVVRPFHFCLLRRGPGLRQGFGQARRSAFGSKAATPGDCRGSLRSPR
jgi:hypothetical protein